MKRYAFRLESVLKVRRIQAARARADLAMANLAVAAAENTLRAHVDTYDELPRPSGTMTHEQFATTEGALRRSAATVTALAAHREAARARAQDHRNAWSFAAQRVSVLERLDDRQRDEYQIEADREAEHLVDDLVIARFSRNEGSVR